MIKEVFMAKRDYTKPLATVVCLKMESALLVFSASTSDPKKGGDPTGGNGSTPNPFESMTGAKDQSWFADELEDEMF